MEYWMDFFERTSGDLFDGSYYSGSDMISACCFLKVGEKLCCTIWTEFGALTSAGLVDCSTSMDSRLGEPEIPIGIVVKFFSCAYLTLFVSAVQHWTDLPIIF